MPKLPVLKPQQVVSRLARLGFVEVRQHGAHRAVSASRWSGYDRALP